MISVSIPLNFQSHQWLRVRAHANAGSSGRSYMNSYRVVIVAAAPALRAGRAVLEIIVTMQCEASLFHCRN